MADLSNGANPIVSLTLNKDRNAAWPVAFIGDVLDGGAGDLAGTTFDRIHHCVLWHVERFGVVHSFSQPWVAKRIAAAPSGDSKFFDELREGPAALGVNRSLFVFNRMPL